MRVIIFIVSFVFIVTNGFAQKNLTGEKGVSSIGGIVGYAIESEKAVIGIDYRYNILDMIRLAPSVLYVIKKDNADAWYFNADAHYLARVTEQVTLYPIAGIGVSAWRYRLLPELQDLLGTRRIDSDVRIGLNLGFGGEIRVTKDIIAGGEFRYNWTERGYSQAMLLARVAYYF